MKTTTLCNAKGLAVSQLHSLARRGKLDRKKKPVCIAVSIAIGLALATAEAREVSPREKMSFDIDAPSLVQALMQFTQQSGLQLMMPTGNESESPAPRVVGRYTAIAALDQLLARSGFVYEFANPRTVAIRVASEDANASRGSEQVVRSDSSGAERTEPSSSGSDARATGPVRRESESEVPRRGIPEILVEGSRVSNVDVVRSEDDVQPYTIINAQRIEKSGASNVEELLKQQLTMNTAVQSNSDAFASVNGTTSAINLRGLGANETLILINGRRAAGVNMAVTGLGALSQPDINGIPLSAVERIEVLPSSASAIYGGSAVGGVVNIVLKKTFDGGDLSYSYRDVSDGHAPIRVANASYGTSFADGTTQVFLSSQYSDGDPLQLGDRTNLVRRGIGQILNNSPSAIYNPSAPFLGATPNVASASAFDFSNYPSCAAGPTGFSGCLSFPNLVLKDGRTLNSSITSVGAGAAPGSDISSGLLANAGTYNLNLPAGTGFTGLSSNFGTVPLTKSAQVTVRQRVYGGLTLFTEASVASNAGRTLYNPFSATFFVPSSAPTSPFAQDVMVSFPSQVGAVQASKSATKAVTIGALAPLFKDWNAELDYTWSQNDFDLHTNSVDYLAIGSALAGGQLNPFVDTAANPLTLAPYLTSTRYSGSGTLNNFGLRLSGSLGLLPAGAPTLTIGVEHRKEGSADATFATEDPATPASSNVMRYFGHSQSTDSLYLEALVPIVGSRSASARVQSLDLQLAGRSERYTVHTGTAFAYVAPEDLVASNPPQGVHNIVHYTSTNPTVGLRYRPIQELTFRVSYATAFLPPTSSQLQHDPTSTCGGFPCIQVLDPQTGLSYLVDSTGGGNPLLKPQSSRSWNFGLIYEPRANLLQGFRLGIEYYKIAQPDHIVSPSVQTIVSDPSFADRITRDPTTGLITTIDQSVVNAADYKTSGWDLKLDYARPTSVGDFDLHFAGTYIDHDLRQYTVGAPLTEYAGFPNDGGVGKLKANGSVGWNFRHWSLSWSSTYYSSYWQTFSPSSPATIQNTAGGGAVIAAQGANSIPSQIYHDLYATYAFKDGDMKNVVWGLLSDSSVQLAVLNVFNSLPPYDYRYLPTYYSPFGSPRLREYRLTIRKTF